MSTFYRLRYLRTPHQVPNNSRFLYLGQNQSTNDAEFPSALLAEMNDRNNPFTVFNSKQEIFRLFTQLPNLAYEFKIEQFTISNETTTQETQDDHVYP